MVERSRQSGSMNLKRTNQSARTEERKGSKEGSSERRGSEVTSSHDAFAHAGLVAVLRRSSTAASSGSPPRRPLTGADRDGADADQDQNGYSCCDEDGNHQTPIRSRRIRESLPPVLYPARRD